MNNQPVRKPAESGNTKTNTATESSKAPKAPSAETSGEDALDHALEESFPASDPIPVAASKVPAPPAKKRS